MGEDIDNFSFDNVISMRDALSAVRSFCPSEVVGGGFESDFYYESVVMPVIKSSSLRGDYEA